MNECKSPLDRRCLLQAAVTAGAASMLPAGLAGGEERSVEQKEADSAADAASELSIIDTNVHLSQWPFRRLPLDSVEAFVAKLRALGIARAWAGSFEAILHRDVSAVNQWVAEACGRHRELVPVGSVNPSLPGWRDDLRRCADLYRMPVIRLYPGYHGYRLDDSIFAEVLAMAGESRQLVQVVAMLEDLRTQHPLVRVDDVDLTPLPAVMQAHPDARLQILNARLRGARLSRLAACPTIFFDTARVEQTDGIASLLKVVPPDRVLYGSHAPFLIPEAALIRVYESDLEEADLHLLLSGNADTIGSELRV